MVSIKYNYITNFPSDNDLLHLKLYSHFFHIVIILVLDFFGILNHFAIQLLYCPPETNIICQLYLNENKYTSKKEINALLSKIKQRNIFQRVVQ